MSKGVNKVWLLGNVGKDPELRSTQGGVATASFSLATGGRKKGSDGNYVDTTEWHNIVAFGNTAEVVRDHVKKGARISIEGKIQTISWQDEKSDSKKYRTEILVEDLVLLNAAKDEKP